MLGFIFPANIKTFPLKAEAEEAQTGIIDPDFGRKVAAHLLREDVPNSVIKSSGFLFQSSQDV